MSSMSSTSTSRVKRTGGGTPNTVGIETETMGG